MGWGGVGVGVERGVGVVLFFCSVFFGHWPLFDL